jgi:hypothetical protein
MKRTRPEVLKLLLAVAALSGGPAWGADAPKGKGVEPPGGGGGGPGAGGSAEAAGSGATTSLRADAVGLGISGGLIDHAPGTRGKWWDVAATFETHGLLWKTNTGCGKCKLFDYGTASVGLNLTRNDRLRVRMGVFQWLLADEGESGFRGTDLNLSYRHVFHLPWELSLRATAAVSFPTGFYSQKAGLYVAPSLSAVLSKTWRGLTVEASTFGLYNAMKANATEGGNANTWALVSVTLEIAYAFWFHPALELGVDGYTGWTAHYFKPQNQEQPVQQSYGGEVYLRYTFPPLGGAHFDLTAALADGDPTLGYLSRNIDGFTHFFINHYSTFEAYGAINLRY